MSAGTATTRCRHCDDLIDFESPERLGSRGRWTHGDGSVWCRSTRAPGDVDDARTQAAPSAPVAALVEVIASATFTAEDAEAIARIIETRLAPPLPTEPGIYLDRNGEVWRILGRDDDLRPVKGTNWPAEKNAPFRRLEPIEDTARAVLRAIDNSWLPGEERMFTYDMQAAVKVKFGIEGQL